jgi:hypothetical protein
MDAAGLATRTIAVMGIPVRFESDAPEVLRAVADCFGDARPGEDGIAFSGPVPRVLVTVDRDDAETDDVGHRVPNVDLLVIRSRGSHGYADGRARRAAASVSRDLLADGERFRRLVLEAMTLFLVTRAGRPPLHAAAVVRGDVALLLAGRSGVGKSTLAYAARRAGGEVLSEDAVYLQREPFRVWGIPRTAHLVPDTARFFPELADRAPIRLANGKTKIPVDLRGDGPACRSASRAAVCLLSRGAAPGIEAVSPSDVLSALTGAMDPGFDHFVGRIEPALEHLAAPGGWRITLPPRPADTIPLLHDIFDALG